MKLKTIVACLLTLALAVPGTDLYAQTRKKSGGAKKRAASAPAKKKAAPAVELTHADLTKHGYIGMWMMPGSEETFGKNVGTYTWLYLNEPQAIKWRLVGTDLEGTWGFPGGRGIAVNSGDLSTMLTSTDGRVFKGKLAKNGVANGGELVYYFIKNGEFTPESLKKSFDNNTFRALVEVDTPKGEEMMFPVEVKFTPNADGTGGTYKFTADNALGLGLIKGTYTFTDGSVKFTSNLDNCLDRAIKINEYREMMGPQIGTKYIDGSGKCDIFLYLFNQ